MQIVQTAEASSITSRAGEKPASVDWRMGGLPVGLFVLLLFSESLLLLWYLFLTPHLFPFNVFWVNAPFLKILPT